MLWDCIAESSRQLWWGALERLHYAISSQQFLFVTSSTPCYIPPSASAGDKWHQWQGSFLASWGAQRMLSLVLLGKNTASTGNPKMQLISHQSPGQILEHILINEVCKTPQDASLCQHHLCFVRLQPLPAPHLSCHWAKLVVALWSDMAFSSVHSQSWCHSRMSIQHRTKNHMHRL